MKLHKLLLVSSLSIFLIACSSDEPIEETKADEEIKTEGRSTEDMINQAMEEATGIDYEKAQQMEEENQEEVNGKLPTFDVGEIMIITEPQGEVLEVVVTKVSDRTDALPDYLQESDYYNWENLIVIEVQYTNLDMSENTSIGRSDFQVYGEDGRLIETINQQSGGDRVSQGRTGTSTFYAEYDTPQDIIELDFILDGETLGTVIADVEH